MSPILMLALMAPMVALAQDDSPTEEEAAPEELPPLTKDPALLEFVQAPYPEAAKAEGVEGVVGLLIEIDEYGEVTYVEVLRPAGNGFDEAAVEAAWQFFFSPAEDANGPTPVAIEFDYGFVLDANTVEGAEPEEEIEETPAPINFEGTVVEMGTRRPLGEISVTVTDATGVTLETATTEEGRFSFRGLANGNATVVAIFPGYERATRQVEITEGEVVDLRLWIRNLSYRDDEIVGVYRRPSEDISRRTISLEEVRRIPGTFGDPVRVIQNLPGAARAPFGSGGLVIRGANPEDSAVYLDGIRIPLIYHLGGYVSVINGDLIDTVDYLPGGYGVQYGRTLGGVIDISTRSDFDEEGKVSWSTDLLDSGGVFRGQLNENIGLSVAARRSYIDLLIPKFTNNPDFVVKPRWYDYQLKLDRLNDAKDPLSVFVFGFQDDLLVSTPDDFAQSTDQDTQGDLGTTYSTHRGYVHWEHAFRDDLKFTTTTSLGIDGAKFNVGENFRIDQSQLLAVVRGELEWQRSPHLTATGGLDFIGGKYWYTTELPFNPSSFSDYDPLAERDPWEVEGEGYVFSPDAYTDLHIRPLSDPDKLLITPGLRFNYVTLTDKSNPDTLLNTTAWDPRISGRWMFTDRSSLKSGVGIYHQPPQPFESWREDGPNLVDYERARAAEVGVEHNFTDAIHGDVSFFGKQLDRLIIDNPDLDSLDDQYFVNDGVGRIYGMEVILRHERANRFFGWISYTLSQSERNDNPDVVPDDAPEDEDGWYLYDLDQTHILVAIAGYQLPRDWEISGKAQYVTGNPYTPYSGGIYDVDQDSYFAFATGERNSERLPPYFTVDLRVDRLFTFKRWQLETYIDFLNVVRGENPEFTVYNYDYTESTYIRSLPFIPSPGFEAEFNF